MLFLKEICFSWSLGLENMTLCHPQGELFLLEAGRWKRSCPLKEKRFAWGQGLNNTGFPGNAEDCFSNCITLFFVFFHGCCQTHGFLAKDTLFLRLGIGKHNVFSLGTFYKDWGFTSLAFLEENYFFWNLGREQMCFLWKGKSSVSDKPWNKKNNYSGSLLLSVFYCSCKTCLYI